MKLCRISTTTVGFFIPTFRNTITPLGIDNDDVDRSKMFLSVVHYSLEPCRTLGRRLVVRSGQRRPPFHATLSGTIVIYLGDNVWSTKPSSFRLAVWIFFDHDLVSYIVGVRNVFEKGHTNCQMYLLRKAQ
jgi:hypothetical protein